MTEKLTRLIMDMFASNADTDPGRMATFKVYTSIGKQWTRHGRVSDSTIDNCGIKECAITASSLDMNMKRITNVQDPVADQDAVTRQYLQIFTKQDITYLYKSEPVDLKNALVGSYQIKVHAMDHDGPAALICISKATAASLPQVQYINQCPGIIGPFYTSLRVEWGPNDSIKIRKTGHRHDGPYLIQIS